MAHNRPPMRLLPLLLLLPAAWLLAAEPQYPLWDGSESVADYAKRVNLPVTCALCPLATFCPPIGRVAIPFWLDNTHHFSLRPLCQIAAAKFRPKPDVPTLAQRQWS